MYPPDEQQTGVKSFDAEASPDVSKYILDAQKNQEEIFAKSEKFNSQFAQFLNQQQSENRLFQERMQQTRYSHEVHLAVTLAQLAAQNDFNSRWAAEEISRRAAICAQESHWRSIAGGLISDTGKLVLNALFRGK